MFCLLLFYNFEIIEIRNIQIIDEKAFSSVALSMMTSRSPIFFLYEQNQVIFHDNIWTSHITIKHGVHMYHGYVNKPENIGDDVVINDFIKLKVTQ